MAIDMLQPRGKELGGWAGEGKVKRIETHHVQVPAPTVIMCCKHLLMKI